MKTKWPLGVYFIGIGGIGMSSLAQVLLKKGVSVSGSDLVSNANVDQLKALGASIYPHHDAAHLGRVSLVVVSTAVKKDNPEWVAALERSIPVWHRSELLAALSSELKSIAIAGTHGKTTTTSMMGDLLEDAGLDPTIINGGIINRFGSNAKIGGGEWCVSEADESDGSFTRFFPDVAVVTNMNLDHMDHYESEAELVGAFHQFVANIKPQGCAVLCIDHPRVAALYEGVKDSQTSISYGFGEGALVRASNLRYALEGMIFDVSLPGGQVARDVCLSTVGEHNVQNALSIIATAVFLKIDEVHWRKSLSHFEGVQRRFTRVGEWEGATIVDDYAHHPVEIEATLKAARLVSKGRVMAVIEPHRYTRLYHHMADFAQVCQGADMVFLLPVYGAGEDPIEGVTHQALAKCVGERATACRDEAHLAHILVNTLRPDDLVMCLGAGKITYTARALAAQLAALTQERCCA